MHKQVYVCDECGAERKEANHWFVLFEEKTCEGVGFHLSVYKWADVNAEAPLAIHLCGRECLQKRIERWAA